PGSKEGTFLIHDYAFAVVPVPQLLRELVKSRNGKAIPSPSLLLAGGIDFGQEMTRTSPPAGERGPSIPFIRPIPGSESEVNDLRAQFEEAFPGAPAPKVFKKATATKRAILAEAPSHRFLHLATHGFFAGESESPPVDLSERSDLRRGGISLNP